MGWFETQEEIKKKALVQKVKEKIAVEGLSSLISPEDYQKIIIEQNDTMISLLSVIAIGQSGLAGDVVTLAHTSAYYEALNKIINK